MNALDDIRIRTGSEVTETEAMEVVAWCSDWYRDVADTFEATDNYGGSQSDILPLADLLRGCDRHIEGGLAFVLADVRRCA